MNEAVDLPKIHQAEGRYYVADDDGLTWFDRLEEAQDYRTELIRQAAMVEGAWAALEEVWGILSDAVQGDCENGVKWLNERAASSYLKEYPDTLAALREIQDLDPAAICGVVKP